MQDGRLTLTVQSEAVLPEINRYLVAHGVDVYEIFTETSLAGRIIHRNGREGRRPVNSIWILARMTFRQAIRRKIVLTGLLLGIGFLIVFSIGFHMISSTSMAAHLQI